MSSNLKFALARQHLQRLQNELNKCQQLFDSQSKWVDFRKPEEIDSTLALTRRYLEDLIRHLKQSLKTKQRHFQPSRKKREEPSFHGHYGQIKNQYQQLLKRAEATLHNLDLFSQAAKDMKSREGKVMEGVVNLIGEAKDAHGKVQKLTLEPVENPLAPASSPQGSPLDIAIVGAAIIMAIRNFMRDKE